LYQALALFSWRWVIAVLLVVCAGSFIVDIIGGRGFDSISNLAVPMIVLVLFFATSYFYLLPRHARGMFREQISMREAKELIFSEDGMEITQASGSFRAEWSSIIFWREMAGHLQLYISRAMVIPLPLNQIGDDRAAFIRSQLIASGLPRPGRRRKKPT
jgi:hypothetical protein